jgi:hypothetical protein
VHIDMLRSGWPEEVLTGRYTFSTRRRDGLLQALFDTADLLTDGLIEKSRRDRLHLRIGGKPTMVVLAGDYPRLPPGIKICGVSPLAALLVLRQRRSDRPAFGAGFFEPDRYDAVDHRIGVAIGMLETTGGFVRPERTVIYDPSGRVVGLLTQSVSALIGCWLLVGLNRYDVTVDGIRVARIQQAWRWWAREYRVHLTPAAGRLDPRLILACALQKIYSLSAY